MSEWQPIETVTDEMKQNGTHFWAYEFRGGDHSYSVCWWENDGDPVWEGWTDMWDTDPNPTHWMPLPSPPGEES